ncbi:MAG: type II toxin-antitoxin system VapC family toxin [Rhodobacteraceae bacterium]|nr:type II toxin-antitoxin system VapC family toxin [Paracoccaceae bacterium]
MIADTSALLAILNREPDAERYETEILTAVPCRMSVADILETTIVVESRGGAEAGHELDAYLEHAAIEPISVAREHLAAARLAWRHFGKGRHQAALNSGDCFAYALADVTGEPLLYTTGDDFARTGIQAVPAPSREPSW